MATMQDVARLAGVSLSTVSYVINGTRTISPETSRRVEEAITTLGYRRNALARGLASKQTRMLALLLPTVERDLGPTEIEFVSAAADAASDLGYHLIVWPAESDATEEIKNFVGQGLVDGVLAMEVRMKDPRVGTLAESGIPFALIGRTESNDGIPYVDIDFHTTVADSVAYLVGMGHTTIGFLTHSPAARRLGYGPSVRAAAAYEEATSSHGIELITAACSDDPAGGRNVMSGWLSKHPAMTAVIAMNDRAAFGVLSEASDRGISIPTDLSVLAIVSSARMAVLAHPALSTFSSPGSALGRRGVEALVRRIQEPDSDPIQELLPCVLEPRESTAQSLSARTTTVLTI